jgi:hypothetical protein
VREFGRVVSKCERQDNHPRALVTARRLSSDVFATFAGPRVGVQAEYACGAFLVLA